MSTPVSDYQGVTPHLIVRDAKAAIEVYKNAFGAEVVNVYEGPEGRVWFSELTLNGGRVIVSDEFPEFGVVSPATLGGPSVTLHMYVDNSDDAVGRAIAAGLQAPWGVKDMHWGDDYSQLDDPFGHKWSLATRRVNYSQDELDAKHEHFYDQYKHEIARAGQYADEWAAAHPKARRPNVPPVPGDL